MNKRNLGGTEIAITPLMLGGVVFGWTMDEKASFAILAASCTRTPEDVACE